MEQQTLSHGLKRMKLDIALMLAGGEQVNKDFSYDRQRRYYIKEIFGDTVNMRAAVEYGRQYKLVSEYMFPNSPAKIKNKRFLIELFASCVLLDRMHNIKSFNTAIDDYQMRYACLQGYEFDDGEIEELFTRRIRDFHNEYTQQLRKDEYEEFCALMDKYASRFQPILKAVEGVVFNRDETSVQQSRKDLVGFERLKADVVLALAGGELVQEGFSYDKQVEYYVKAVYGNLSALETVMEYGKEHKRSSQYMFPNLPEKIHKRRLLFQVFAGYVLLQQISLAESYSYAVSENNIRKVCNDDYETFEIDMKNVFINEIASLHSIYMQSFTEKNFETYKKLMNRLSAPFNTVFEKIKAHILKRNDSPDQLGIFIKLCDRWGISKKIRISFRLKMEAFLEAQIGSSSQYIDYVDNLQHTWQDHFPKYPYTDNLAEYVRQEKNICIIAYGSKLGKVSDEQSLLKLLASVNIKLAIANGCRNIDELNEYLHKISESLPREDWQKIFNTEIEIIKTHYFPESFRNYGDEIIDSVTPYRDELSYINDILIEEINFRANGDKVVEDAPQPPAQIESEAESPNYEEIIAQKDAEILSLQKDLEYYENLDQRNFRNDILQYDKGLTDVVKKLCERKFGAPLNELYLMSADKKEITPDNVKAAMQNFLFILNSLGVNAYDNNKIGKTVKFDSEDANIAYAVDEKKLVDGINKGVVKYPGWKYKGEEFVLPVIDVANTQ